MPKGNENRDLVIKENIGSSLITGESLSIEIIDRDITVKLFKEFREVLLQEIPISKGLKAYLKDPNDGLFNEATLKEVFQYAKTKSPFLTGSQVILLLVLHGIADINNEVVFDTIKGLEDPTGLNWKTISKNLKLLLEGNLLPTKHDKGLGFIIDKFLHKGILANQYKLNSKYFNKKKEATKGKGKNKKIVLIELSGNIINLSELIKFKQLVPTRLQDRATYFYLYLSHLFTRRRKGSVHTQDVKYSQLRDRIFSREAFNKHSVFRTIELFLSILLQENIIQAWNKGNNRYGQVCYRITWISKGKHLLSERKGT